MIKQYLILILLFFTISDVVNAQVSSDTIKVLQQINITATRLNEVNETSTVQVLDTTLARLTATTLAEQLTREGGLFIKSYGPGSLSTLSLRGSNASQTAVLWNGINICSPMLGLFDLGLIPTFLVDETTIQFGGSGAEQGSAAIGGAIHLNSRMKKEKGFEVNALASAGSFGFYEGGFGVKNLSNKVYTNSRIYFQGAQNNFKFNNFDDERITQSNAKFSQIGFAQDLSIGNPSNLFSLNGWYLKNQREIPPHMLTTSSAQQQDDEAIRIVSEWQRKINYWNWNLHSGWSKERLNYRDLSSKIEDLSTSYLMQNDAEISYHKNGPLTFTTQLSWLHNEAVESAYGDRQKVNQENISFLVKYQISKLTIRTAIKQGYYKETPLPLLPSIALSWKFRTGFLLKGNIAKLYRVPTLNDLYWKPGGNPELKPESGLTESVSIEWRKGRPEKNVSVELGCYNTRTNEEIVWLPENNGLYHAQNINEIWSRGVEVTLKGKYHLNEIVVNGFISAHYILATITKTDASLSEAVNNELSYNPKILLKENIGIRFRKWSLNYYHDFTGERYTSIDNSQSLKPFQTGELDLAFEVMIHKSLIHFFCNAKNIWNEKYQVIAYRAMPGRSFQAGMVIKIK